ncbi:MAG: ferredoxin [Gemmatimonadales bacterium]|nr:MAG: ferredoxin [Gemmatimonadales bacterium]
MNAGATGDPEIVRVVGDLTVTIDRLLCVGFGDCIDEAPAAFEFDDEGIAILTKPENVQREDLLRACESCPVDAITVTDRSGQTLVPEASVVADG